MRIERKDGETLLGFMNRVTRDRKELDLDYTEWSELLTGEQKYSSENLRKAWYFMQDVLRILQEEEERLIEEGIGNEEKIKSLIKENQLAKLEMEKEKIKMRDQRREYKKYIRESARFENLTEVMVESIERLNIIKSLTPRYVRKIEGEDKQIGVAIFSDWHIGSKFSNSFAKYDTEIARDRIEQYVNDVQDFCAYHDINTIKVCLLGDGIEGQIHTTGRIESSEDAISQLMLYCELVAQAVTELSVNFKIEVHSVIGNHTRTIANKKECLDVENFERLVPYFLKARLQENDRVKILDSNISNDIDMIDILGNKVCLVHGDKDNPNSCLKSITGMLQEIPDYILMGHYHNGKEFMDYQTEIICGGSLKGADSYCVGKRLRGLPSQKFLVFTKNGKLCSYDIKFTESVDK